MKAIEGWKRFKKKQKKHSDLDIKSRTLKVKLDQEIIIPNIHVKLH